MNANAGPETDVDALIGRLIPTARLPRHLQPRDLLDEDVVPPESIAARVHALRALIRTGGREPTLTGTISTSRDLAAYFVPLMRNDTTESIWVVGLDARNRVRFTRKLASGNATNCAFSAAEAARPLVLNGVGHGIVVHNHPSGDPTPSSEDLEITVRIAEAFDVLGLRLLDHVIVASEGYTSMLDSGVGPFGAAHITRRLR